MITDEQLDTIEHAAHLLVEHWRLDVNEDIENADMQATGIQLRLINDAVRAMRANSILTENALKNAQAELAKPKGRR